MLKTSVYCLRTIIISLISFYVNAISCRRRHCRLNFIHKFIHRMRRHANLYLKVINSNFIIIKLNVFYRTCYKVVLQRNVICKTNNYSLGQLHDKSRGTYKMPSPTSYYTNSILYPQSRSRKIFAQLIRIFLIDSAMKPNERKQPKASVVGKVL